MLYVLAGNFQIAQNWAKKKDIKDTRSYRFISESLLFKPNAHYDTVIITCDYFMNSCYLDAMERIRALGIRHRYESCCQQKIG